MTNVDLDSTNRSAMACDTSLSPGFRPDVLGGLEHKRQRLAIEASLFGGVTEALLVGRFRLLQRLGEGGMGTVYAAFDDRLDRKIAVKLIRPSRLENAELRERTQREARALARVSHPNVVHVYEVGEIEDQLFVAMEFLAGPTLRGWLEAQPRAWREVLSIFCQAGEGLAAAHAQGIIHRDFKPDNAMLGADGRVRVLDFGLARIGEFEVALAEGAAELDDGALTKTGALLGTPAYMASEHLKDRQVSVLSDQFSFCVALFEALYGHRPFAGKTIATLRKNLEAGAITARPRDTEVPRWVHAVLLRGLALEPGDRWPSMRALLVALARDPRARRRRVLVGALLVTFAGALSYAAIRPNVAPSELEVCANTGDQVAQIWGQARAASVEQTVRARHGAQANEVLALVTPQINRYANQWAKMRDEACRTHAEGQQSDHVFDLRTACLDQRLASLDTLVQILAQADPQQLQEVGRAAAGLPAIDRCADTAALLAAIAPPDDPSMRGRVQGHRETLERVRVYEDSGQFERGLELVADVLADQEATTYEPLVAEAYLYKGCIETWVDPAESVNSLSRALWTALGTGHVFVAARASSKRGQIRAESQPAEAKNDLPMIAALNRRVEDDPVAYAEYLSDVGHIHEAALDDREARRWLEAARDLRIARQLPIDWRTLATLLVLGNTATQDQRNVEAAAIYRDLAGQVGAVFPSTHPAHIITSQSLALAWTQAGRPFAAIAELRRCQREFEAVEAIPPIHWYRFVIALSRLERETGDRRASQQHLSMARSLSPGGLDDDAILHELMHDAAAEGDTAAVQTYHSLYVEKQSDRNRQIVALQEHARALATVGAWGEALVELETVQAMTLELTNRADSKVSCDVAFQLGRARRKLGKLEAAERELVRALAEHRAVYPIEGPLHAIVLYELGELALDRRRWADARVHLEAAESIYATTAEDNYLPRARARFAHARALTEATQLASPEARALAESALLGLRDNAQHDAALEVEAWIADH